MKMVWLARWSGCLGLTGVTKFLHFLNVKNRTYLAIALPYVYNWRMYLSLRIFISHHYKIKKEGGHCYCVVGSRQCESLFGQCKSTYQYGSYYSSTNFELQSAIERRITISFLDLYISSNLVLQSSYRAEYTWEVEITEA